LRRCSWSWMCSHFNIGGLRLLDGRAVAVAIALVTLVFAALWFRGGGRIVQRPRSMPSAVPAGLASGVATMMAHSGGPPLAMYLLPLGLAKEVYAGNDESVLHRGQLRQGGTLAPAGEADERTVVSHGVMPASRPARRLNGLEIASAAGPVAALSGLLRPPSHHVGQAVGDGVAGYF
jgi:hypothetical protein